VVLYDALRDGPPCPRWCAEHETSDGWNRTQGSPVKHCRRAVHVDGGAEIVIERYAAIEDGSLIVLDPEVRVRADEALTLDDAQTLADTLRRVTELVTESVVAA
jgi:hypothetical protein